MADIAANVQQLEKRAGDAEKAIESLHKQMASGGAANIESRLRELLKLMLEDREECEAVRAQRDDLKQENERLRLQVSKGEYRIKHLMRTIDEIEGKKTE